VCWLCVAMVEMASPIRYRGIVWCEVREAVSIRVLVVCPHFWPHLCDPPADEKVERDLVYWIVIGITSSGRPVALMKRWPLPILSPSMVALTVRAPSGMSTSGMMMLSGMSVVTLM
jgi:hypothetical protein